MATPLLLMLLAALAVETLASGNSSQPPPTSFSLQRFDTIPSGSAIGLIGGAEISGAAVTLSGTGSLVYGKPLRFVGTNPGFSTNFSFSNSAATATATATGSPKGLSFLLIPSGESSAHLDSAHELKSQSELESLPSILSVKYVGIDSGASGNRIEIVIAGEVSATSGNLSSIDLDLVSGEKLQSWIDYDGKLKRMEVRLTKFGASRPTGSVASYAVDLSNLLWREAMYVGISSWSKDHTHNGSEVYSWSFALSHGAPYRMHSEPLDPHSFPVRPLKGHHHMRRPYPWRLLITVVFGAACVLLLVYGVLLLRSAMFDGRPVAPVEYADHAMEEGGDEKVVLVGDKLGGEKAVAN